MSHTPFSRALALLLKHAIGRKLQLLDLALPEGESKRLLTRGIRRARQVLQALGIGDRRPAGDPAPWFQQHTEIYDKQGLARISHHLTVEARHRPAITALRLLTYLKNAGGHSMLCPYKPVGARKRRFQTPLRAKPVALAE